MTDSSGPRRDPRRLFSASERNLIASRQHWRCQECAEDLPELFHAHHVVPWSSGGRTHIDNGVAICPECHKTATTAMPPTFIPRTWQNEAAPPILGLLRSKQFATLSAAPGAGKTLFAAWIYRQLLDSGDVARMVVFVPNGHLRHQWKDEVKELNIFLGEKGTTERSSYDGVALTYHTLNDAEQCRQIIRDADETPTLFILDEVHHLARRTGGETGAWAANIERIVGNIDAPRHAVLNLSGTLFRSKKSERITTIRYTTAADGKTIETLADYSITAGALINAGQLRHIKVLGFDADMRVEAVDLAESAHAGADTIRAIDIDADIRFRSRLLRGMIRNDRYVSGILQETVSRLGHASIALGGASVKGLVIADDINHADQVYATLCDQLGTRCSFIAHGKVPNADNEIERFRKSEDQAVLVAVQKVTEGFDVPDICTLTYLRSGYAPLLVNQMVARAMRITKRERQTGKILPATILVPNEVQIKGAFADVLVGSMRVLDAPSEPCDHCGQYACVCPPWPRQKICPTCEYPYKVCTCPCRTCGRPRYECGCPIIREPRGLPHLEVELIGDAEVASVSVDGDPVNMHVYRIIDAQIGDSEEFLRVYIEQMAAKLQAVFRVDPSAAALFLRETGS